MFLLFSIDMTLPPDLTPLSQIESNQEHILAIKRNDLLPLLNDTHRLNSYADHLVQAQCVLLKGVDPKLNQQLSDVITQIIQQLSASKKYLGGRRFNALQKWLGIDVEYDAGQIKYVKDLDHLISEANHLFAQIFYFDSNYFLLSKADLHGLPPLYLGLPFWKFCITATIVPCFLLLDFLIYTNKKNSFYRFPTPIRWGVYYGLIICILFFGVFSTNQFIYFQF